MSEWLLAAKSAAESLVHFRGLLEALRKLVEAGAPKDEIVQKLKEAEQQVSSAEAHMAQRLGYEICRAHWPPVVMLEKEPRLWCCPECGRQVKSATLNAGSLHTESKWRI